MTHKAYRHGEILLIEVDKLPQGAKKVASKTLMTGSHGNHHTFDNGQMYTFSHKKNPYIFGYLKAQDTRLYHPEHKDESGSAAIPDGIYELRKQQEFTPQGLVPVID